MNRSDTSRPHNASNLLETTDLLTRAQKGDRTAKERLFERFRSRLERWASGRLPSYARSLFDTGDVIQETLVKAIENLGAIEARGPGSFEAYVRQAILNRIRDQIRWARRRPAHEGPLEGLVDAAPSPLESAIGEDVIRQYEAALARLSDEERQLVYCRIELALDYAEIAAMTGRPSPAAARMAIQRAVKKLAELMSR